MEIQNAYDKNFNIVKDITLIRGKPIPDGLYRLVCDVIVRHKDGTYLLMLRDKRKHFCNMWEATAGGSALYGETPVMCAVRELREETGIIAANLIELGKEWDKDVIYVEFLCITDCDKNSVTLQEGETCDYKWVDAQTLIKMKGEGLVTERMFIYIDKLKPV